METQLQRHQKLVQTISEEASLLEQSTNPDEGERHSVLLEFLIELQTIKAKELLC
jgi:hypothetical protein